MLTRSPSAAVPYRLQRTTRGGRCDEVGAFLVLWAIALVSVLLFAALAVDLGNIAQTKQHARNAADDAALAAVGDLAPIANGAPLLSAEATAVADAEKYVQANYSSIKAGSPSAGGAWGLTTCQGAPWNAIPAPAPWGIVVPATVQGTDCIGFFATTDNAAVPTGMAVMVPTQNARYTFGKAGGLTSQGISAIGLASIKSVAYQYLLPFGYPTTGAPGLVCLGKSSLGACRGFTTGAGDFKFFCSPRYNLFVGSPKCESGSDPVIEADLALGLDHPISCQGTTAPCSNGPEVVDYAKSTIAGQSTNYCSPYDGANYVVPQPGLSDAMLTGGVFAGFSGQFQSSADNAATGGCGINTGSASTYIIAPRLNHADGDITSATDQADATPASVHCLPAAGGVPCLSARYGDTFDSGYALNGVQVTDYLLPAPGSRDPATNPYFSSCYGGTAPGGGTPDPTSDAIDEQVGGTSVWVAGDAVGTASCPGGFAAELQALSTTAPEVPIFSSAIESSPRFGIVPVYRSVGSTVAQVVGFYGTYLDLAFGAPGGGSTAAALLAWIFPLTMIQGGSRSLPTLSAYLGGQWAANLCNLSVGNC